MSETIITFDRSNQDDTHRHYSITGIAFGRAVGVCCRRKVLPTGPSTQEQIREWHLWWIKDPLIPEEYGAPAVHAVANMLDEQREGVY